MSIFDAAERLAKLVQHVHDSMEREKYTSAKRDLREAKAVDAINAATRAALFVNVDPGFQTRRAEAIMALDSAAFELFKFGRDLPFADYPRNRDQFNALVDALFDAADAVVKINQLGVYADTSLPETQRKILKALEGRALSLKELVKAIDANESALHRDHLKPLMASNRIKNDREVGGYYRPDKPPK